jgi:hypothetical protein
MKSLIACLTAMALGHSAAHAQQSTHSRPMMRTPKTQRVSVSSSEVEANIGADHGVISASSRYIAFVSRSTNLVANDTNNEFDIFLRDRILGTTTRVSVGTGGTEANDRSDEPHLSVFGEIIAFTSDATNLVPGDTNGFDDVFVHDRIGNITTRVSVSTGGAQGTNDSWAPKLTADGHYVLFTSRAGLVPQDTNNKIDIYLHDRNTGVTSVVSDAYDGTIGNGHAFQSSISPDGTHVSFESSATNLIAGGSSGSNLFLRDLSAPGQIELVVGGSEPSLSLDGRYIAFQTGLILSPDDNNFLLDIYVYDAVTQAFELVSEAHPSHSFSNGDSYSPVISWNGKQVAFTTESTTIGANDTNGQDSDIFARNMITGKNTLVSKNTQGVQGDSYSGVPSISALGKIVAYGSASSNLVPNDNNGTFDAFITWY